MWDHRRVLDHKMLTPKRHLVGSNDFNEVEVKEFIAEIFEYEKKGYSIYTRAPYSTAKSIPHQHTHLIKLGKPVEKFGLFVQKPHINFFK